MSEYALEKGRPADTSGRLGKEIRVYDFLDRLGIDYERVDHPALMTMEACESVDKILDTRICKNLFLRNAQRTQFYLLLMPGDKKFKTAVLSKQIGSARLSFAEPEFMLDMLDITPGSVSSRRSTRYSTMSSVLFAPLQKRSTSRSPLWNSRAYVSRENTQASILPGPSPSRTHTGTNVTTASIPADGSKARRHWSSLAKAGSGTR